MTTHDERQKALEEAVAFSMERTAYDKEKYTDEAVRRRELLRDCVAIPRSEWEQYRKALWFAWQHANYVATTLSETSNGVTRHYMKSFDKYNEFFKTIGFLVGESDATMFLITPAAHAFAESMKEPK